MPFLFLRDMPVKSAAPPRWPLPRPYIVGLLLLALTGCHPSTLLRNPLQKTETPVAATAGIALTRINGHRLINRIAEESGRVVLVDFWATHCGPCRASLPNTLELQRRYRDQGLTVLTVSLDGPQKEQEAAEFLHQLGTDGEHFIGESGFGSKSFEEFGIASQAIPFFKLYDRQGNLKHTHTGASPEIEAQIRALLRGGESF